MGQHSPLNLISAVGVIFGVLIATPVTTVAQVRPWSSFQADAGLASTTHIDWNQTPDYLYHMERWDGVFPKETGPRDFRGIWRGQGGRPWDVSDLRRGREIGIFDGGGGGLQTDITASLLPGEEIVLTEYGADRYRNMDISEGPAMRCLPYGPVRVMLQADPKEYVQNDQQLLMLTELQAAFRQIHLDGRDHPAEGFDLRAWWGHSVGHWEGNTLVIETVGVNDRVWIDFGGLENSTQLHLVERLRKLDDNTLLWAVTVTDPVYFQKPFTAERFLYRVHPDDAPRLLPGICHDGETDFAHRQPTPPIRHRVPPTMPDSR